MTTKERLLQGCSRTELALAYLPTDTPKAALRTLSKWILRNSNLKRKLTALGYRSSGKQRLSPKMVELIINTLGEP